MSGARCSGIRSATAILDRLLHHSTIINIREESYRLREKKRAGQLAGPADPIGSVPKEDR